MTLFITQVYKPVFPLSEFINHFIFYEGYEAAHRMDRFLPDGNTEFVINLDDNVQSIYDNESLTDIQTCRYGWVSGVRTRPITIPSGVGARMLIVAFRQGKALPFYQLPLSELTDWVADADLIFGNSFHNLREKLVNAASIDVMFRYLETFFVQKAGDLLNSSSSQKCVEFAVSKNFKKPDLTSFQKLDQVIGYSQKHFINLFKKQVGLAPKQYHKIMRFQKAIVEIESQQSINWSNIALESGFYDQAHFINDFKTFSGFTPNEYIKKKSGIINYILLDKVNIFQSSSVGFL